MVVVRPPVGEADVLRQLLHLLVGQDDELLVGGRVEIELIAVLLENLFHLHGFFYGVTGQLEVEVVGKQRLELQADECALGNDGSMLFLYGEEVLMGIAMRKHYSFAAQGSNLGTADVEDVAMASQIGEGDIIVVGHQAIAKASTVNIKGDVETLTYLIDIVELAGCIEGAQL